MPRSDTQATHISSLSGREGDSSSREISEIDSAVKADSITRETAGTQAERVVETTYREFDAGETVGHFVLSRMLGEGGFGQVWLACDTQLDRQVAIKFPHRRLAPDTLPARRFQREAEIAAKLVHPNLIPILEAVLHDDQAYIVSEYCEGPTLMQWIRDRAAPVPPRMAVSIVAQLASGLAAAHDRGLIHRDIKPSNVILTAAQSDAPVPRLTDFGMARTMADPSETRIGTLLGSGQYMSPEQATGNTDEHGPHSDVHALGVLLYELLTGESPFAAASEMDTIRRIVSQDPVSVRQRRPSLSRDLSAVCQRCMEKQPSRRYHNAGELLADLQRVLDGRPTLARPIGRVGRMWRWSNRNRVVSVLAASAVLGLLVGVIALFGMLIQAQRHALRSDAQSIALSDALVVADKQHQEAQQQRLDAQIQRNHAVFQEAVAQITRKKWRQASYISDISLAFLRFHQGHYGEVRKLLDRQKPSTDEYDLRTIEWWLLDSEVRARYATWGHHDGQGTELVFSAPEANPNGTGTVVSAGLDGELLFWDVAGGEQVRRLSGFEKQLTAIASLPSGPLLIPGPSWPLFGSNVVIIDPVTGKTRSALHAHSTTIESIRASADGSMIASGSRYENIRCWSVTDRKLVTIENGQRQEGFGLSADGARLITSNRAPGALQVWDTHSGELIDQWKLKHAALVSHAHQHDLAAYSVLYQSGVGLVDSRDLQRRRWIQTQTQPHAMEFSSDDSYLALADYRSGMELFQRVSETQPDSESESESLSDYRSIGKISGIGGRIEDIAFTGDTEFATVSLDGAVERFAPLNQGHVREILELLDVEFLAPTHHPGGGGAASGVLALNKQDGLVYSQLQSPCRDHPKKPAVQPQARSVWKSASRLNSMALSSDERTIAVTDDVGNLHLLTDWRDASGTLTAPKVRTMVMPPSPAIRDFGVATFSADDRFLAVTGNTGQILVYDLSTQSSEPVARRWYENLQSCMAFSPSAHSLFISGFSGIELIDVLTNETRFHQPGFDQVASVCFPPIENRIIVGLRNGALVSLDPATGQQQFSLYGVDANGDQASRITQMNFVNQSRLVTISKAGRLYLWDLNEQVQIGSMDVCCAKDQRTICRFFEISDSEKSMLLGFDHHQQAAIYHWTWDR